MADELKKKQIEAEDNRKKRQRAAREAVEVEDGGGKKAALDDDGEPFIGSYKDNDDNDDDEVEKGEISVSADRYCIFMIVSMAPGDNHNLPLSKNQCNPQPFYA